MLMEQSRDTVLWKFSHAECVFRGGKKRLNTGKNTLFGWDHEQKLRQLQSTVLPFVAAQQYQPYYV